MLCQGKDIRWEEGYKTQEASFFWGCLRGKDIRRYWGVDTLSVDMMDCVQRHLKCLFQKAFLMFKVVTEESCM